MKLAVGLDYPQFPVVAGAYLFVPLALRDKCTRLEVRGLGLYYNAVKMLDWLAAVRTCTTNVRPAPSGSSSSPGGSSTTTPRCRPLPWWSSFICACTFENAVIMKPMKIGR